MKQLALGVGLLVLLLLLMFALGFDVSAMAQDGDARVVRESTPLEQARPWVVTIVTTMSLGFSIYLYLNQAKRSELKELTKESESKIEELKGRFDRFSDAVAVREGVHAEKLVNVSDRLRGVEERLKLTPTADDIHIIALRVAEVVGDVKAMAADMRALARSSERTEDMVSKARG